MSVEGGRKAILAAFFANLGIAFAKMVAFVFTRAASMLAESIHSFADAGNQGLLILGQVQGKREPSPSHPFGYGRARYFWAFVVALVLFSLGGLFAIFEAIEKLRHPHEIESPQWAFGVLALGIVLESFSLRTAYVEASHVKGRESWVSFIRRSKTPELPVVLLEDIGAMLGLVVAMVGVALAVATDNPMWDAIGSLVIGLLLVVIAFVLAVEMRSLLLGEAASARERRRIVEVIEAAPRVTSLIHMRTQHIGPEELLVAAKVEFDAALDMAGLSRAIDDTEERIRAAVPIARMIYLEPAVREPTVEG